MYGVPVFSSREELLDYAIKQANKTGLFIEFGVGCGYSVNYIAERINGIIFGFDSFLGLPGKWNDYFDVGAFSLQGRPPACRENVKLVVGLFEETLPKFIKDYSEPLSFLHIDCDLYSSTKTVFKYLGDRINSGVIIVFDEYFNVCYWKHNEFKAFQEFVAERKILYDYLGYNSKGSQVAVRIR